MKEDICIPKSNKFVGSVFRIITIIVIFVLLGAPIFLIPRHNTIFYPEYWFEHIIYGLYLVLFFATDLTLSIHIFFKEPSLIRLQLFLKIYAWDCLNFVLMYSIVNMIWVVYLGMNYPIPFLGLGIIPITIARLCGLWFLFPTEFLSKEDFRKKLKMLVLYFLWWAIAGVQKDIITIIFQNVSVYIQWLFGFVVLIMREMNKKVLTGISHKITGGDHEKGDVLVSMNVSTHYAFFIALHLSNSHISTVICMLLLEFSLHLKMTHDLIRLKRNQVNNTTAIHEQRQKINNITLKLVIAELCEGLIPLAYSIAFSMMYYGPNFGILGVSIEENEITKDVGKTYGLMLLLFTIDLLSALLNTYLVNRFGKINLADEFCRVLDNYWYFMLSALVVNILQFMTLNDINWAMDWSFNFMWVTDEGRNVLIYNSTILSEVEKAELLFNATLI